MSSSGVEWFKGPRRWIPLLAGLALVIAGVWLANRSTPLGLTAGLIGVAVLGFLAKEGIDYWKGRQDETQARQALIRSTTATAVGGGAKVALVRDVKPGWLRQRRARIQVEYQRRDAEEDVRRALANGEPVLLVGHSMAGKSTLIEHVVTITYPDHHLWTPQPDALPKLLQDGTVVRNSVLCLDDLERYLTVPGLRSDWVTLLHQGGAVVIAAIRGSEYDKFTLTETGRHSQLGALEQLTVVRIRDDDALENERLAKAVPSAQRDAVREFGLGAFLGGGPQARDRYENNRDAHPLGCAFVRVAADWRRIGLQHITRNELIELGTNPHYLPARHLGREDPDDALGWATQTIDEIVHLLEEGPDDTIACTDYILDHLSDPSSSPPLVTWETALTSPTTSPNDLMILGFSAREQQLPGIALKAYIQATTTDHPDIVAAAWVDIGNLEQKDGRIEDARAAYLKAVATNHPDIAAAAWINLGDLEKETGRIEKARDAYLNAVATDHPEVVVQAWVHLGHLEREAGRIEEARNAYLLATASGGISLTAWAWIQLGDLEKDTGRVQKARDAYLRATSSDHFDLPALSWIKLGDLEKETGRIEKARNAYQRAITAGSLHPSLAPAAEAGLRNLKETPYTNVTDHP
jgi:tetratricopeptide (TPR) repeat protein